jgi:hypothetical protein
MSLRIVRLIYSFIDLLVSEGVNPKQSSLFHTVVQGQISICIWTKVWDQLDESQNGALRNYSAESSMCQLASATLHKIHLDLGFRHHIRSRKPVDICQWLIVQWMIWWLAEYLEDATHLRSPVPYQSSEYSMKAILINSPLI